MYGHKKELSLKFPSEGAMFMNPLSMGDIKGSVKPWCDFRVTEEQQPHSLSPPKWELTNGAGFLLQHQPQGLELPQSPGPIRASEELFPFLLAY